jgi:putative membrane protein
MIMIMLAVLWLLVIAATAWLFRLATGRPALRAGPHTPETPLEILQRRYAGGDVGRDEYDQKRRDLTGPSTRDDR